MGTTLQYLLPLTELLCSELVMNLQQDFKYFTFTFHVKMLHTNWAADYCPKSLQRLGRRPFVWISFWYGGAHRMWKSGLQLFEIQGTYQAWQWQAISCNKGSVICTCEESEGAERWGWGLVPFFKAVWTPMYLKCIYNTLSPYKWARCDIYVCSSICESKILYANAERWWERLVAHFGNKHIGNW